MSGIGALRTFFRPTLIRAALFTQIVVIAIFFYNATAEVPSRRFGVGTEPWLAVDPCTILLSLWCLALVVDWVVGELPLRADRSLFTRALPIRWPSVDSLLLGLAVIAWWRCVAPPPWGAGLTWIISVAGVAELLRATRGHRRLVSNPSGATIVSESNTEIVAKAMRGQSQLSADIYDRVVCEGGGKAAVLGTRRGARGRLEVTELVTSFAEERSRPALAWAATFRTSFDGTLWHLRAAVGAWPLAAVLALSALEIEGESRRSAAVLLILGVYTTVLVVAAVRVLAGRVHAIHDWNQHAPESVSLHDRSRGARAPSIRAGAIVVGLFCCAFVAYALWAEGPYVVVPTSVRPSEYAPDPPTSESTPQLFLLFVGIMLIVSRLRAELDRTVRMALHAVTRLTVVADKLVVERPMALDVRWYPVDEVQASRDGGQCSVSIGGVPVVSGPVPLQDQMQWSRFAKALAGTRRVGYR